MTKTEDLTHNEKNKKKTVESKSPRIRMKTPLRLWVGTLWISSSRQLWQHRSSHPAQRDCSSVKTRTFSSANTFSLNSRTFIFFPSWIRKCISNGTYLQHWSFRSFVRVILRLKEIKAWNECQFIWTMHISCHSMKWQSIYLNIRLNKNLYMAVFNIKNCNGSQNNKVNQGQL